MNYWMKCIEPYCDGEADMMTSMCDGHILLRRDQRWRNITQQWFLRQDRIEKLIVASVKVNSRVTNDVSFAD